MDRYTGTHNNKHMHVTPSTSGDFGEASFGVGAVVRDMWELFVLLGQVLLHKEFCGLE